MIRTYSININNKKECLNIGLFFYFRMEMSSPSLLCENCQYTRVLPNSAYGLTTPNASPIETHVVNCLNSAGRFHHFSHYAAYSVAYQDKAWNVLVQKQARWGYADQLDFDFYKGDNVCLLNIHKIITSQYFILFH